MVSGPCIAAEATNTEATGARRSSYDIVVIGAGIAGLVAGALLARVGKAVLVVESDPQPGGYAQSLRHGEHVFDRADHLTWGAEPEGPLTPGLWDALLRYLDVRSECEFLRVDDPVYAARFPGLDVAVPSGQEPFLDAHLRLFPNDAAALRRLTELSVDIYLEMQQMPLNPGPLDLARMPRRFPLTWQYRSATLQDVLDAELTDARLKSACCALWYWIGTPPSRQPFLYWASMMTAFIQDGACYPRGGFQQLADALVIGLEKAGGELLTGMGASTIVVDGGRVGGVELSNGQRVTARAVVSTGDPRDTFGRLVPRGSLPGRYRRRLRRFTTSVSVYALYAATDLDVAGLGVHHDTSFYPKWDHDAIWQDGLDGKPSFLSVRIPTLTDPTLGPPGQHIVILKAMAPSTAGLGHAADEDRAASMLELAERVLPGLSEHLTYLDRLPPVGETPGSPLHLMGPIYGWEAISSQIGARRLAPRTPIKGLVLAGQWTQPGHGLVTVAQSGLGAARLILGKPSAPPLPLNL